MIVGSTDRMARHTSMPVPSGRRPSRTATSGRSAGIRLVASSADPDSPTTSMSPARTRAGHGVPGGPPRGRRAGRRGSVSDGHGSIPTPRVDVASSGEGPVRSSPWSRGARWAQRRFRGSSRRTAQAGISPMMVVATNSQAPPALAQSVVGSPGSPSTGRRRPEALDHPEDRPPLMRTRRSRRPWRGCSRARP